MTDSTIEVRARELANLLQGNGCITVDIAGIGYIEKALRAERDLALEEAEDLLQQKKDNLVTEANRYKNENDEKSREDALMQAVTYQFASQEIRALRSKA